MLRTAPSIIWRIAESHAGNVGGAKGAHGDGKGPPEDDTQGESGAIDCDKKENISVMFTAYVKKIK